VPAGPTTDSKCVVIGEPHTSDDVSFGHDAGDRRRPPIDPLIERLPQEVVRRIAWQDQVPFEL
jgi:hypothetical protein